MVFDNFLNQSNHRMELEKATIFGDNKRANRGQIVSAIIVFLCIATGGFLIYHDKNIGGLATILGSLATLLTAFYSGAIIRKKERLQKEKK
jgi:drug/metabolite transporter (DMT)-like permease